MIYNTNKFNFTDHLLDVKIPENSFVVDIQQQIGSQNELYDMYKRTVTFPDYFGDNWDAFFDVLKDFSWVPQENIIIRHFFLPVLPDNELRVYLEILADSVEFWTKFDRHKMVVYFSIEAEEKIKELMSKSK